MNPIKFKQVGLSTDYNDPLTLSTIEYRLGEQWYTTVPKSAVPNCKLNLGLIRNSDDCVCDANILESTSCLVSLPNDNKSYLSVIIPDFENIEPFVIYRNVPIDGYYEPVELFLFDGGTFDELVIYAQSYKVGVEVLSYGLKLFFNIDYATQACFIETSGEAYLLTEALLINRSNYYGITFNITTVGCYRLALINTSDEVLAISNKINVVAHKNKFSNIIEYNDNGFYHRFRTYLYCTYNLVVEEDEKKLSSGNVSISNVITRQQASVNTGWYSIKEHRDIIRILKSGVKLGGEKCFLRGEYSLSEENHLRQSTGSGTLYFPEDSTTCYSGQSSEFQLEFIEEEKIQNVI